MSKSTTNTEHDKDFDGNIVPTVDYGEMTFAELVAMAKSGDGVLSITDVEDRQPVRKEELVNIPFVVTGWSLNEKKERYNNTFSIVEIVVHNGDKKFFTDGSTGIRDQLIRYENGKTMNGTQKPFLVPHGLKPSDYNYTDPDTGETTKAVTYYFNTTA